MEYLFRENPNIPNILHVKDINILEECYEGLEKLNSEFNSLEKMIIENSINGVVINESFSEIVNFIIGIIISAINFLIEMVRKFFEYISFYISKNTFVKMNMGYLNDFSNTHNFKYYGINFIVPQNSLHYVTALDDKFTLNMNFENLINNNELESLKNTLSELNSKITNSYYNHIRGFISTGKNNVYIDSEDYPLYLYNVLRGGEHGDLKTNMVVDKNIIEHHKDFIQNITKYKNNIKNKKEFILKDYKQLLSTYENLNIKNDYSDDINIEEVNNYKTVLVNKYISHIKKMTNINTIAFAQEINAYKHKLDISVNILEKGIQIVKGDTRDRDMGGVKR